MVKNFLSKKIYLSLSACLVIISIFAGAITVFMFAQQFNGAEKIWRCMTESAFLPFILNVLPILLATLLAFFLTGSASVSCGLVGFAAIFLTLVNRYKIVFRKDALMPWDLTLGAEFMGIARSLGREFYFALFEKVALAFLLLAGLIFFVRTKRMRPRIRLAGAVCAAGLILAVNFTLLNNAALYSSLHVEGNIYNTVDNYDSKGFLYSFIYNLNSSRLQKPVGYDRRAVDSAIAAGARPADEVRTRMPHVIMVLSEAFSDFPIDAPLSFEGFTDPLANYKQILQEARHGYIVTPGFGGGTADTEFDIFTGVNTRHFRGIPYSFRLINKPFNSMARTLSTLGYANIAIHPGYGWFYNRQNVYLDLGFSRFISSSEFPEYRMKGMYIDETYTMEKLREEFEKHLAENPGQPLFEFLITIQNHGPYPDKYLVAKNFNSSAQLSQQDENELANYLEGLADADRELGRLTEYLKGLEEPVVLLYFGDHRPALSVELLNAMLPQEPPGSPGEKIEMFEAPYILWQNPSAEALESLGKTNAPEIMSANYLGALLLTALGQTDIDPYFSFLADMMTQYPIVTEHEFWTETGGWQVYTPGKNAGLDLLIHWEYYRVTN
ncbi:MAG: LTA synthase family protein [Clostridiales bacterium]|jgi:phosphoglycerol transferase MdoB-like AlkP superfamily enzyme|nr:LTA synthase family protein [Clostridiales bacterium]